MNKKDVKILTGAIAYYTSEICGYVNGSIIITGCNQKSLYETSDIKYIIDSWALDKFQNGEVKNVHGYSSRLISGSEIENLGYSELRGRIAPSTNGVTPNWVYNSSYNYWTMEPANSNAMVYLIYYDGYVDCSDGFYPDAVIRPVINVYKSALETNGNNE